MERGLIFGVLSLVCAVAAADVSPTLVFNMGFAPDSPQAEFQVHLARAVFDRLGIATEFVRVGAERALVNVDQGIDDGNLVRVAGLDERYTNIVRVPEAFLRYDFVAITRDYSTAIEDWDDLAEQDVAIVNGWKVVEDNVRRYRSLTQVADGAALFDLLQSGRVQTVVYERVQARRLMAQLGCHAARIIDPPLASRSMYMYLNRRHAALVPQIEQALRDLKQDGTYDGLRRAALGVLTP